MDNRWIKLAGLGLFLPIALVILNVAMNYGTGEFESDNNFNRYDIKVITDPNTGCEYLIQDRNRVGELLPRYDDNGKIRGCKSE